MKFMKPLAITLLAALSFNVAMATPWCGYDASATLGIQNIKSTDVSAMGTALNAAAQKCGYSTTAGHSSKVSAQLTAWATACKAPTIGANIASVEINITKCALNYANLKQQNPAFLSNYKYPADYQSYEVSHGPFCDAGTNPANHTDYTNDSLCQCIEAFGYANQSNDGTTHPVNMIGHAPYSWLSDADKATYKARAKYQINYVLGLGSNTNNLTIYTGTHTTQTPASCCSIVGGVSQSVATASNPGGVIGMVPSQPAAPTSCK